MNIVFLVGMLFPLDLVQFIYDIFVSISAALVANLALTLCHFSVMWIF